VKGRSTTVWSKPSSFRDEEAGALVGSILALVADEFGDADEAPTPEDRAETLDALPTILIAIRLFWRGQQGLPMPRRLARKINVGRNEPCPCGSGRKYKKCCGSNANPTLQ
jgi:uncharacterized protein YecA (UPF0149 family)